jgi:hypothetical protein
MPRAVCYCCRVYGRCADCQSEGCAFVGQVVPASVTRDTLIRRGCAGEARASLEPVWCGDTARPDRGLIFAEADAIVPAVPQRSKVPIARLSMDERVQIVGEAEDIGYRLAAAKHDLTIEAVRDLVATGGHIYHCQPRVEQPMLPWG